MALPASLVAYGALRVRPVWINSGGNKNDTNKNDNDHPYELSAPIRCGDYASVVSVFSFFFVSVPLAFMLNSKC